MNLPTITDIKIKNSSGNKNSNTILVSTRKFEPNTHRIILRVNKKFYDDLKYHIKEVVIDEGRSQFQLPGMNESVTIFAQLYDYKNDRIICTKKKDFTKILGSWGLALGDSIMSTQNDYFNLFWNSNRKVVKVNGPFDKDGKLQAEVKPGERYYFTAEPNQKLHSVELLSAKWAYQYDDGNPVLFKNHNETIKNGYSAMDCEFHADPRKIKVFAYFQQRNENVMVEFANFGKAEKITPKNQQVEEQPKESAQEEPEVEKISEAKVCIEEARVRAFIRMVRVGEGTGELIKTFKENIKTKEKETIYIAHDFQKGYTTAFGGNKIKDLSTHPQKIFKAKPTDKEGSSAAGAYQVMQYTWWELAGFEVKNKKKTGRYFEERDRLKKYKITDYHPESQDKICIILMEKQRPDLINKIIANKIEDAIQKDGCYIWASLPETSDKSHYFLNGERQPATSLKFCIEHYEKFLKEELKDISPLHLKKGFLEEFDKNCCKESKTKNNKLSTDHKNKKDIDLRNKMKFRAQKTKTDCNLTCRSIMSSLGVVPENPTEKGNESYYQTSIESKDHKKLLLNADDFKEGMNYIDKSLEAGYPIMVGVNHTLNYGYNESTNTSDHYVIIVGRFWDQNILKYRFWDVATKKGAEGDFKFILLSDKLYSNEVWKPNRSYTLTQVRRNLNKKGKLIQF